MFAESDSDPTAVLTALGVILLATAELIAVESGLTKVRACRDAVWWWSGSEERRQQQDRRERTGE